MNCWYATSTPKHGHSKAPDFLRCISWLFLVKMIWYDVWSYIAGREQNVRDMFNSYHPKLQFTIEMEVNDRIPFLDMWIIRDYLDGSISTKWYMKIIASGRLLNYYSAHHYNQKINTAMGIIHRVVMLTSNVSEDTFRVTKDILSNNNYPPNIISRLVNRFRNKLSNNTLLLLL